MNKVYIWKGETQVWFSIWYVTLLVHVRITCTICTIIVCSTYIYTVVYYIYGIRKFEPLGKNLTSGLKMMGSEHGYHLKDSF